MDDGRLDAKNWLRSSGYIELAEKIESIESAWKAAGKKTRRNWWDVLAGKVDGRPSIVAGYEFPVLAEARRRQNLPLAAASRVEPTEDTRDESASLPQASAGRDTPSLLPTRLESTDTAVLPLGAVGGNPSENHESQLASPRVARELVDSGTLKFLERQLELGRVVLVTGAGFSMDARDERGRSLPSAEGLARELFNICYPEESFDGSPFGDLYQYAQRHRKSELRQHLTHRFTVDPTSLDPHYGTWFGQPWRRVYTLNYDDIEVATAHRFGLPREVRTISATNDELMPFLTESSPSELAVIHLNGFKNDKLRDLTASPQQYGYRLGKSEPWYEAMVAELAASTCIYVGTQLDESILWKYIELRGAARGSDKRPRAFLVTPRLTRGRQGALADFRVQHVEATAKEFAELVLAKVSGATQRGLERLIAKQPSPGSAYRLPDIDDLLRNAHTGRTEYLLGEQPVWSDITSGRVADRQFDNQLLQLALAPRASGSPTRLISVTGTAGAGKSSTLMKVGSRLVAGGWSVGWLGSDANVPPALFRAGALAAGFEAVIVDDLDRYGHRAAAVIDDLASQPSLRVVICSVRASRSDVVDHLSASNVVEVTSMSIPGLSDPDIECILDVLAEDHKLGRLTGLSRENQRQELRSRSDRQLLVAMIEATSGRKFEEKVIDEWEDLTVAQRSVYSVLALANTLRENLTREDLLLCLGNKHDKIDSVVAIQSLLERRIVLPDESGERLRVRHRVIADTLLDQLRHHNNAVQLACEDLAHAMGSRTSPGVKLTSNRTGRILIRLINHKHLLRLLDADGGRAVYCAVEDLLGKWNHHFWLQRGSLELERGSILYADRYLNISYSLAPGDPLVVTAYAYMLMKRAASDPRASGAEEGLTEGMQLLRAQIASRGKGDFYPYHVLGSQSVAWVSRCSWSRDQKVDLLKATKRDVEAGLRHHPRNRDLQTLSLDMQSKIIAIKSGLSP